MSSVTNDTLAAIHEELHRLRDEQPLFVVEGKRDRHALTYLGFKNIIILDRPLFAMVEMIAQQATSVILLTDLDKEGKKIYTTLASDLQRHAVVIDTRLRELLFKTPVRQIEGFTTWWTSVMPIADDSSHHTAHRRHLESLSLSSRQLQGHQSTSAHPRS